MPYWVSSSSQPFDDTLKVKSTIGIHGATSGGIDTRDIDGYRQGVELNTVDKFFKSTQPKLWGGSIKFDGTVSHQNEQHTYGQSVSYTEFLGVQYFDDRLKIFNPVDYMGLGGNYPFPILTNGGPQEQEANTVEPFTIPFKKNTPESNKFLIKGIHGSFENAQESKFGNGGAIIEYFYEFGSGSLPKPFLDQGEVRFGTDFTGSIIIPGYTSQVEAKISPFNDQVKEYILKNISGFADPSLSSSLRALKGYALGDNILPVNHKGSAAGHIVYGPNSGRCGIDSIAFIGRTRGS
jgi:hypothetical protein